MTDSDAEAASRRIDYLISRGAVVNGTEALVQAVVKSNEYIRPLLSNGADPNLVVRDSWRDGGSGQVALVEAAAKGSLKIVKLLFAYSADINIVDGYGKTALEAAERCNRHEVRRFLHTYYLHFVIWISRYTKQTARFQA